MQAIGSFFSSFFGGSPQQLKVGKYTVLEEELLSEGGEGRPDTGGFGFVYRVADVHTPSEKYAMKKIILTVGQAG